VAGNSRRNPAWIRWLTHLLSVDTVTPIMEIPKFKNKQVDELRNLAEQALEEMKGVGYQQAPAHLLTAQLYMAQASRLEDEAVADRDFKMAARSFKLEIWVIVLIGLEIVLSLVGLTLSGCESRDQMKVLRTMNETAGQTLQFTKNQNEAQQKSLQSLSGVNDKLQNSLKETAGLTTAMREQLKILQDQQAAQQAILARKPKLELFVGDVPLNSPTPLSVPTLERTTTKTSWKMTLLNSGDATATRGTLRAIALAKGVTLDCSAAFERVFQPDSDGTHTILIPFVYDRPHVNIPMSLTANYSPGQGVFTIIFNVDADEIPSGTQLGAMIVTPPPQQ
jgi:hypothetical protein